MARREERSKEVKDAEACPVAWRRGADWTAVLHITSASPSQVNLVMVDISIAIKLRNLQKCAIFYFHFLIYRPYLDPKIIVAKKRDPGILDPELFWPKLGKLRQD